MPPRRRRAGSRPGNLSADLTGALRAEAETLAADGGPIERVRAVNDFYAQLDFELEQVAEDRLQAVREVRNEGMSYARTADLTRLSNVRVQQLANAAAVGGRRAGRRT